MILNPLYTEFVVYVANSQLFVLEKYGYKWLFQTRNVENQLFIFNLMKIS